MDLPWNLLLPKGGLEDHPHWSDWYFLLGDYFYLPVLNLPYVVSILACGNIALMSKTAGSIVESVLRRDPHEVEYIQAVQEVVHSLEPVLIKNAQ